MLQSTEQVDVGVFDQIATLVDAPRRQVAQFAVERTRRQAALGRQRPEVERLALERPALRAFQFAFGQVADHQRFADDA